MMGVSDEQEAAAPAIEDDSGGALVEEGAPIWMTTFGDLMSLLLTFFVLLFSMSEIKMDKFVAASQSFSEAMGGTSVISAVNPAGLVKQAANPDLKVANAGAANGASQGDLDAAGGVAARVAETGDQSITEILADQTLDAIARQVQQFVEANGLTEALLVDREATGVRVRIQSAVLFEPGAGTIDVESSWIIEFMADLSSEVEVPVIVAGHADDQPISTAQFASNWELSAYRAAGIARALVAYGHDPARIRVESFGSARPIATNETPEGRAQNRRVEFFYDRQDLVDLIGEAREQISSNGPEVAPGG